MTEMRNHPPVGIEFSLLIAVAKPNRRHGKGVNATAADNAAHPLPRPHGTFTFTLRGNMRPLGAKRGPCRFVWVLKGKPFVRERLERRHQRPCGDLDAILADL